MPDPEKPRITIVIGGGVIQSVHSSASADMEVDILDVDDNGTRSDVERAEMRAYLSKISTKHHQIY